jgi:hypothetical protein
MLSFCAAKYIVITIRGIVTPYRDRGTDLWAAEHNWLSYNRHKLADLKIWWGETVQKYYSWAWLALGGATVMQPVLAQVVEDPLGLSVEGGVEVRNVENAGLQPDSADQVSETRTIISLGARGELKGSWAEFVTNYRVEDRRYSEFDEQDERLILGDSALTLGPQHQRYYLQFSHSSREVSLDPLAADRPTNRDNRELLSVVLYGSLMPGAGNTVGFGGGVTEIRFDESIENEATRYNVGAMFERMISPVSRAGISVTGYELEYENLEGSDLTYSRVALTWLTNLSRLSYELEAGANRIETDIQTETSPSLAFTLAYRSGAQALSVSYNQYLSDTSQGAQATNDAMPITNVEVDGRLAGVVDQFKLQQFALSWTHAQVCAGCELRFNLGVDQEKYVTYSEFDSREMRAGLSFSYLASPAVILSLSGDYRDFKEINDDRDGAYDELIAQFTVGFPRLIRDGRLELFVGQEKRDFDLTEGYDSSYVGARFRYRFW